MSKCTKIVSKWKYVEFLWAFYIWKNEPLSNGVKGRLLKWGEELLPQCLARVNLSVSHKRTVQASSAADSRHLLHGETDEDDKVSATAGLVYSRQSPPAASLKGQVCFFFHRAIGKIALVKGCTAHYQRTRPATVTRFNMYFILTKVNNWYLLLFFLAVWGF